MVRVSSMFDSTGTTLPQQGIENLDKTFVQKLLFKECSCAGNQFKNAQLILKMIRIEYSQLWR